MAAQLSVNLNAIALLRNRRDLPWPSVVGIGRIALNAGAAGLTVHPRPDQRHIRFSDLGEIKKLLDIEFPTAEFNIEGYPTEQFLDLVFEHRPHQVTLVPDDPSQPTSDHGWDFLAQQDLLTKTNQRLRDAGFRVALFCDPDANQDALSAARDSGTHRLELYTGPYGSTFNNPAARDRALDDLQRTADRAHTLGLAINAGHDLTVDNVPALGQRLPELAEVSIGNGLTADALIHGMAKTVRRFNKALG